MSRDAIEPIMLQPCEVSENSGEDGAVPGQDEAVAADAGLEVHLPGNFRRRHF